jgi:hypothetical protein
MRTLAWAAVAVLLVAVVLVVTGYVVYIDRQTTSNPGGAGTKPLTFVLASNGTEYNLTPYEPIWLGPSNLTGALIESWVYSGTFVVSDHCCVAALATAQQYANWTQSNGSNGVFLWTSGMANATGIVSKVVPSGDYYFAFEDRSSASGTLSLTSDLVVQSEGE